MKRTLKKFVSLVLVAALTFALSATAYASHSHYHPGYLAKESTKSTPYGTMTGCVHIYAGASAPEDMEIAACTYIDSKYTMALVTTKMECVDDDTGKSLEWQYPTESSEYNQNECCLRHYHENTDHVPITIFTTHEITYTSSYVLYMVSTAF